MTAQNLYVAGHALPDTNQQNQTDTHLVAFFQGNLGKPAPERLKPIWILMKQGMVERQWHHLDRMQICTSLRTDKHASTQFFTGRMLFLMPNQYQSSEGNQPTSTIIH